MTIVPTPYPRTSDIADMRRRATPATQAFYDYWDGKRAGRRMPSRRDLDPIEMKPWLPGIQLIDVHENPRRLIYRLVGEVEVAMRGFNHIGREVAEAFFAVSQEEALRNYGMVIDRQLMVYDWARYLTSGGFHISQETIFVPLSNDDEHVNMVITFTVVNQA